MLKAIGLLTLFVIGLFVFGCFTLMSNHLSPGSSSFAAHSNGSEVAKTWEYSSDKDTLTDKVSTTACLKSTNKVDFSFPYAGGSTGSLCLRISKGVLDGYFEVDRGQLQCLVLGCTIHLRFDNGPVQSLHALSSRTGEATIAFLTNAPSVMRQLKKSHRVRLAADFYQAGEQTFEFDPDGFDEAKLYKP